MRSSTKSLLRLLATMLTFTLIAAACGDDDASSDTSSDASSDTSSDTSDDSDDSSSADDGADDTEAPDDADDADEAESTTDDPPAEEKAPVKIGLIAQDEELLAFPEVRSVSQAFIDYFNAELDGAEGHPIELDVCGAGDAPESHVACAQQFANDDSINLVISGGFLGNSAAAGEVLVGEGVPYVTLGNDFIDYLTPGQFTFDPGLPGLAQVFFVFMGQTRGDVSATLFIADDPAFAPFIPALEAIAAANGVEINEVVPLGFEPDLTGPVSAANTDNDGWLFVLADGAQCTASASAVATVGYEGNLYANDLCMGEDVIASGALDGWAGPVVSSAPTIDGGEDVDLIIRVIDEYGDSDSQRAGLGGWALANMYIARDILIAAGLDEATRESVMAALSSYSSDSIPGYPAVACPGPSAWVGACNQSPLMVTVADGQLTSPDGFVQLDFAELDFLLG